MAISHETVTLLHEVGFPNLQSGNYLKVPTFQEIFKELPYLKEYSFIINFNNIGYYHWVGMQPFIKIDFDDRNVDEAVARLYIKYKEYEHTTTK